MLGVQFLVPFVLYLLLDVSGFPFNNVSLPWDERVDDLVSRLTLEEMMNQMIVDNGSVPAISRLGIKPYSWGTECLRGAARSGNATSFPESIGLGAMFSEELLFKMARATGEEVRAKNTNYTKHGSYGAQMGLSCFSPVINIMRDSRWGRNEETYGEDPYLSGVYSAAFVHGLQGDNPRYLLTNAGCKHFDAYGGPETIPVSRFSFDAKVSMRDWRTTFLPAFRTCVKAGTYNLMCSYNSVNGIPACAHKELLTDILRTEWGFKGYIISDAGAVINIKTQHRYTNTSAETVAACLNSGCNAELVGYDQQIVFTSMIDAVNQGLLTEDRVREMMKPMWYTRMRLGEFDPPEMDPYKKLNLSMIQSEEHRALSLELALKSFVLLKNLNDSLPLSNKIYENIAIVGPLADNPYSQFGDYTPTVDLHFTTTPLDSLSSIGNKVQYAKGCIGDNRCLAYNKSEILIAVKDVELVFVCLGLSNEVEDEGNDRANISLPGYQAQLYQDAVLRSPANAKVILILFNAGPVDIRWADRKDKIIGILEAFYPAQATGDALKLALVENDRNMAPFGRLPYTWPQTADQLPPMVNYSMEGRTYRYLNTEPLYPFGYGLTYTQFSYSNLVFTSTIEAGDELTGSVIVTNIGTKYDADEIVQIYLSWNNATVVTPIRQLVNFTRVFVPIGSSVQVPFTITAENMAIWREDNIGWEIEPGSYGVSAGGQQPFQKRALSSNVLISQFIVTGSKFLGKY